MSQTKAQLIDNLVQPITGALGSASAPTFSFTSDPNTGLYSPSADQLALTTGGTGRLFVDELGRVGVGAAAVAGVNFNVQGSTPIFRVTGASATNPTFQLSAAGITSWSQVVDASNSSFYISKDGTERLRITSAGLVGIGTSSASTNVEINAALDTGVSLGLNEGQLSIGREANSGGAVRIGYDTTNNFGFISSGRVGTSWDRLILNAGGGNVGIGTTNPGALLHVANKIRFGSNASYYAEIDHDAGSTGANIYNSWDTGGHIFQRNGNEQLRITGAGEVGINTSSPLSRLGIAYTATGGQSDGIRLSDTTNTTVSVLGTTGSSYSYAGVTGHNTLIYGSRDLAICADNANNGIIKFMAGGTERVRITNNGLILGNNSSIFATGRLATTTFATGTVNLYLHAGAQPSGTGSYNFYQSIGQGVYQVAAFGGPVYSGVGPGWAIGYAVFSVDYNNVVTIISSNIRNSGDAGMSASFTASSNYLQWSTGNQSYQNYPLLFFTRIGANI